MKYYVLFIATLIIHSAASAQKIESIQFNLYTDSLKKGFYNYISVDGKYTDGTWLPLDSTQLRFRANTGHFKGNDLFIDSSYTSDSVIVRVTLKRDTSLWRETVIYIRKRGFDEPLKTNEEILNSRPTTPRKRRWW